MKHSHYAVMGGFAIVPGKLIAHGCHDIFLPRYFEQLTITPDGLEYLANPDIELVPNISEAEIRDKSNANGLGKAFVCIQAHSGSAYNVLPIFAKDWKPVYWR
jgi:hypothetical protein